MLKIHIKNILINVTLLFLSSSSSLSTDIIVRSTEIDVNGHVNNAKYIEYLQWGRWDWLEEIGITRKSLKEQGVFLVVVNININFRKELNENDKAIVYTNTAKLGEKSFTVYQEVRKDDLIVADATVTMVSVSEETRKACPLPENLKKSLMLIKE